MYLAPMDNAGRPQSAPPTLLWGMMWSSLLEPYLLALTETHLRLLHDLRCVQGSSQQDASADAALDRHNEPLNLLASLQASSGEERKDEEGDKPQRTIAAQITRQRCWCLFSSGLNRIR